MLAAQGLVFILLGMYRVPALRELRMVRSVGPAGPAAVLLCWLAVTTTGKFEHLSR